MQFGWKQHEIASFYGLQVGLVQFYEAEPLDLSGSVDLGVFVPFLSIWAWFICIIGLKLTCENKLIDHQFCSSAKFSLSPPKIQSVSSARILLPKCWLGAAVPRIACKEVAHGYPWASIVPIHQASTIPIHYCPNAIPIHLHLDHPTSQNISKSLQNYFIIEHNFTQLKPPWPSLLAL